MPLPNEAETHLLRAALLRGNSALASYAIWREKLDFDALTLGSQRVLALLHKNLRAHDIDDPLMGRLRGIARYAWFSNRNLIFASTPLLEALNRAGIKFAFLKGMAIIASVPDQLALRPMGDVDLLVRPSDASAAMDILSDAGWWPHYGTTSFIKQEVMERSEGYGFERGKHIYLDLHWQMLKLSRWAGVDADLWSRVIHTKIGDIPCCVPSFEDQVLHAFVHGAPWDPNGALRWAADSVLILRTAGANFDWDYLLRQARQRHVLVPVRECIKYLAKNLEVSVPESILSSLDREPVSRVEIMDYRLRGRDPVSISSLTASFLQFQNYRRSSQEMSNGTVASAFCSWIRHRWAVDTCASALAMTVLKIVGHPNWLRRFTQRMLMKSRIEVLKHRTLPSSEDGSIDLTLAGNPKGSLLYGWSDPETEGRWTDDSEAALALDIGPATQGVKIGVTVSPMLVSRLRRMRVKIWANDVRLPDWLFKRQDRAPHRRILDIPGKALTGQPLVLTFVLRNPRSPKSLGISSDDRRIGLFVRSLTFEPVVSKGAAP
ncbi:hypothetical protein BH10PSE11_BH10PSE11_06090 [soil metagenome]